MRYFFSETGDYLGGFDNGSMDKVPAGAIEVEAPPAHGLDKINPETKEIIPYVEPLPMAEQLDTIFNQLSPEIQADFSPLKAAVKLEIDQGRLDIAKLIIQRATVPPELDSIRTQMLSLLP